MEEGPLQEPVLGTASLRLFAQLCPVQRCRGLREAGHVVSGCSFAGAAVWEAGWGPGHRTSWTGVGGRQRTPGHPMGPVESSLLGTLPSQSFVVSWTWGGRGRQVGDSRAGRGSGPGWSQLTPGALHCPELPLAELH